MKINFKVSISDTFVTWTYELPVSDSTSIYDILKVLTDHYDLDIEKIRSEAYNNVDVWLD